MVDFVGHLNGYPSRRLAEVWSCQVGHMRTCKAAVSSSGRQSLGELSGGLHAESLAV